MDLTNYFLPARKMIGALSQPLRCWRDPGSPRARIFLRAPQCQRLLSYPIPASIRILILSSISASLAFMIIALMIRIICSACCNSNIIRAGRGAKTARHSCFINSIGTLWQKAGKGDKRGAQGRYGRRQGASARRQGLSRALTVRPRQGAGGCGAAGCGAAGQAP